MGADAAAGDARLRDGLCLHRLAAVHRPGAGRRCARSPAGRRANTGFRTSARWAAPRLMLSFALYPYVYLLARTAFLEHSRSALEAGRLAGLRRLGQLLARGAADRAAGDRRRHGARADGDAGRLRHRLVFRACRPSPPASTGPGCRWATGSPPGSFGRACSASWCWCSRWSARAAAARAIAARSRASRAAARASRGAARRARLRRLRAAGAARLPAARRTAAAPRVVRPRRAHRCAIGARLLSADRQQLHARRHRRGRGVALATAHGVCRAPVTRAGWSPRRTARRRSATRFPAR